MSLTALSRRLGLAALCLATLSVPAAYAQDDPATPSDDSDVAYRHPLERVVVIGASITGGFGSRVAVQTGGDKREASFDLGMVMDYILKDDVSVVTVISDYFYFKNPDRHARKQTFDSRKQAPTTIVAVDLLFWFVHQDISSTGDPQELLAARLAELDRGLSYLDNYAPAVNIIVGDIPDMGPAVGNRVAFLSPQIMPLKENLDAINQHIRDWATLRGNAQVVPLSKFYEQAHAGQDVTVGSITWPKDVALLQDDKIHPTADGLIAIGQLIADAMEQNIEDVVPSNLVAHSPAVRAKMLQFVLSTDPIRDGGASPNIGTKPGGGAKKDTESEGDGG